MKMGLISNTKNPENNFKIGDIIRYSPGISALFKYTSKNGDRFYGEHVMGGTASCYPFELELASELDIEFCKAKRPEWFITKPEPTDFLNKLRQANIERDKEWNPDKKLTPLFRATELGGECGEALNIVKKLERERLGIKGSRATINELASELSDILICVDLLAMEYNIDLHQALRNTFNATSEKQNLSVKI